MGVGGGTDDLKTMRLAGMAGWIAGGALGGVCLGGGGGLLVRCPILREEGGGWRQGGWGRWAGTLCKHLLCAQDLSCCMAKSETSPSAVNNPSASITRPEPCLP